MPNMESPVVSTATEAGGFTVTTVTQPPGKLFNVTLSSSTEPISPSRLAGMIDYLEQNGATAVAHWIFGGGITSMDWQKTLGAQCGLGECPITVIDDGASAETVRGLQILAVSGFPVQRLIHEQRCQASIVETDQGRCCFMGDLRCADLSLSRGEQTTVVFETIERLLDQAGMDFSHLFRTWLFLDRILDWYDEFNDARNRFFTERGVYDRIMPASTGIGAPNPCGSALVAGGMALESKTESVRAQEVTSPLQCPASDYRSSFSRALEIVRSGLNNLYVSGTASIDGDGNTIHLGSSDLQIDRTMEVVRAILETRQMDWRHVYRGVVYFKDFGDVPLFEEYCRRFAVPPEPLVLMQADVCRDDLLFEIEVDAIRTV